MDGSPKLVSVGNYKLDGQRLGKGTFARVELGTHMLLNKKVALKVIVKSKIRDPYLARNLTREASILCRLNHPNIIKLLEVCRATDLYCLVLEYLPGGTLFELIQKTGALPEDEAKGLCRQLVSALAYLHGKRIIHRDLKLENIMLSKGRLVLIDFGLSNSWHPGKKMNTHCGSAEYASPELFDRAVTYDTKVDVWSFGIILYSMTLGHLPFQITHDGNDGEDTLPKLIKSIMKGLSKHHYLEMNKLSIDCRVLIIRCLDTCAATRIRTDAISVDPWIGKISRVGRLVNYPVRTDLDIATDLKVRLKIKLPSDQILSHVQKRKYCTTGGCFNILKMSMEDGVELGHLQSGIKSTHGTECTTSAVKRVSKERRCRSQDNAANPKWKRNVNDTSDETVRIPRLQRVDSVGISDKVGVDSGIIKFGQKTLQDIGNTIRPLLRKNSKKGSKPTVFETEVCQDTLKNTINKAPIKDNLFPQTDKKFKLNVVDQESTRRKKSIR